MNHTRAVLACVLAVSLAGCQAPPPRSTRKPSEPAPPVKAQETSKAPAFEPVTLPVVEQPKTAAEPKPPPSPPPPPPPPDTTGGDFQPGMVAGRSVGGWVEQLRSGSKDDILEAIQILRNLGAGARSAAPRLSALTSHQDPAIANAAREALQAIQAGDGTK